jgi:hypothetical protein
MREHSLVRSPLRPLGIGEMLDRAVSLSVRFFVPLALVWAVFAVPIAVLQYFGTANTANVFATMIDAMSHAKDPRTQQAVLQQMSAGSAFNGYMFAYLALFVVFGPLASGALMRSCSDAYLSRSVPPPFAVYRTALHEWLPLLAIAALWIVVGGLAYLLWFLVMLIPVMLGVLIGTAVHGLGITVMIAAGILWFAVLLFAGVLAFLAVQVAFYTQLLERPGIIRAFASGIARVAARNLRRSLGVGFALAAVYAGFFMVATMGQALLYGVLRSNVLGTMFSVLLGIAVSVFVAAYAAIYYYDVRVRSEGFDLEMEAASEIVPARA